jgi:hypothetical protein
MPCKGENPLLGGVLCERSVHHSIRSGFADGFLFPYREALELARRNDTKRASRKLRPTNHLICLERLGQFLMVGLQLDSTTRPPSECSADKPSTVSCKHFR